MHQARRMHVQQAVTLNNGAGSTRTAAPLTTRGTLHAAHHILVAGSIRLHGKGKPPAGCTLC